ncbi:MAG: inorganic diphosphatase [Cyclonatronaceae bacterium]
MNLNVIADQTNSNCNLKSRSPVTLGAGLFLALYLFSLVSSPATPFTLNQASGLPDATTASTVEPRSPGTTGTAVTGALQASGFVRGHFPNPAPARASAAADSMLMRVVVEIPAGEHRKIEFNKETELFEVDRIIRYLPYPVNYGFIPGTYSDPETGGDGDPMDVMILSRQLNTGHEITVIPVATLRLTDRGEQDDKVLAVPADVALQSIHCTTWQCILEDFPLIPELLETWFTSYKGAGVTTSEGWAGTEVTLTLIREAEAGAYQEQ